jgi:outer membrane protein insertion porin family
MPEGNSKFKMQNANAPLWRVVFLPFAFCILHCSLASAQTPPATVVELVIEQEGRPVLDPQVRSLIETMVGKPLAIREVRESITHLTTLDRFDDVRVLREDVPSGIRLRYVLVPSHPVDRIEFRGTVAVDADDLRRAIRDRFGVAPPAARRADEVAMALKQTYQVRGFPNATITPRIEEFHNPDRATMVFEIQAGARVAIANVKVEQRDQTPANVVVGTPDVRVGQPYDAERVERELNDYAMAMRERGYLEAQASHSVEFTPQGADVTLLVSRGPHVTIAFTGDPIPSDERDRLVPIRTEASVSQDLLEDSQNAIVTYLRARGYGDAQVEYQPVEQQGELTLTFNVQQGPRYIVERILVTGNTAIPTMELIDAMRVKGSDPFVQATVDARAGAIVGMYRNLGYTKAQVRVTRVALPNTESQDVERRVDVAVSIVEGPKAVIRSVAVKGNNAVSEPELRPLLTSVAGKPYTEVEVIGDRDRLELEYRNRGYENVTVAPRVDLVDGDTQADVSFTITEGQQVFVDHVIIVGNRRTSTAVIERELVLKPGEPLGSSKVIESQQRLTGLGLFRRVRITAIQRGSTPSRDVVVRVEEAPPNTHAYGAGLEVSSRLATSVAGTAEERYEFVPRGSFEIGRRNMGGKNRSVNLFTRMALRRSDLVVKDGALSLEEAVENGFNEYRVFTTYREPRIFDTRGDLLISGLVDQARRTGFNFNRREARAEFGLRASQKYSVAGRYSIKYSVAGRYSIERTKLFDVSLDEDEKPLIDRLFPQVRLSKFSGTLIRDGRQDLLDPAGGTLLTLTTDLAMRAIRSEVGFVKSYVEAFAYPQLPVGNRTVLALGGRLGLARGFERQLDAESFADLPASERFFAGGDTTVRGFSLDRLGTNETITTSGFPTGGNAVVILNAELRFAMPWSIQAVTFIDAGNVYTKSSKLSLTELRPAYGVGARVRLPLLTAPIRVDVGINPDRREIVSGTRERGYVFHISLGQAF